MRQTLYLAWQMFLHGRDIREIVSFVHEGLLHELFCDEDDGT